MTDGIEPRRELAKQRETRRFAVWEPPPEKCEVRAGEVHLWRLDMDSDANPWSTALSLDESERAARFAFERDRRRFKAARGALRHLLGAYLDESPSGLQFGYGANGKPYLPGRDLSFNLSHSGSVAVYAITEGAELGVDVEEVVPRRCSVDVAHRFFSASEYEELMKFPLPDRAAAFFSIWVRKEAFIKATGMGLSYGLDQFEVSCDPDGAARILRIQDDLTGPFGWWMQGFVPAEGYAGAVAAAGEDFAVRMWDLHACDGG